ncbi:MAG: Mut7-C RNAse domain-containing protein, partial [Candidatus Micrarchaeota archaeon]|nr:Mut7-C RNAse domain-containing protein [Candidatus Micrarchaeota archaeon]
MARRQGRRKKFLVDVMLIKLGRWLRILGYDCRIPNSNEIDDDALLEIAKNEKRILLTMDRKLAERKSAVGVIYIPSNNNSAKAQLEYLIRNKIIKIPSLKGVLKVEDF